MLFSSPFEQACLICIDVRFEILVGFKTRRSVWRVHASRAMVIPAALAKGETATIAANRVMLVDPRGEIDESALLEFLEAEVEPRLWPWLARLQRRHEEVD